MTHANLLLLFSENVVSILSCSMLHMHRNIISDMYLSKIMTNKSSYALDDMFEATILSASPSLQGAPYQVSAIIDVKFPFFFLKTSFH